MIKTFKVFLFVLLSVAILSPSILMAETGKEIDVGVTAAMDKFAVIKGSDDILKRAEGVLVFPQVFKGGFGIGGEYGEGALRVGGKTVDYYNTAAASIGFQLGAQKKTIIIAFMDKKALEQFRSSEGWKVGVDASVAVITVGAGGAIDTANTNKPIIAFVLDQKGLMYNLTLEGAKISKIAK